MPSRPQQSVMADATKVTARLSVTWPVPRPPVVCEKNIVRLFRYPKGQTIRKVIAQGKIKWKKIDARQLILKNIHALA